MFGAVGGKPITLSLNNHSVGEDEVRVVDTLSCVFKFKRFVLEGCPHPFQGESECFLETRTIRVRS